MLQLKGWSRQRRVILVRESPAVAPVGAKKRRRQDHLEPPLAEGEGWDPKPCPWSGRIAVLVTSEERHGGFPNVASVNHYRERADAGQDTAAITAISKEISRLATAAEQSTMEQRWLLLLVRIFRHYF